MATPKCANCGCVITRFKKDIYCPKCQALFDQDQPYKMFKRRTKRMLLIGLRDSIIIFIITLLISMTRIGRYLKWYVFASAILVLVGALVNFFIQMIKTNRKMYQEGYGSIVEENDFFARTLARMKKRGTSNP